MKKNNKNINSKISICLLTIFVLFFSSCDKSNEPIPGNGDAQVMIQIDGVSFVEDDLSFEKKASTNGSSSSAVVKDTSIVYDDFVVDVLMTKDNNRSGRVVSNSTVKRSSNENMAASTVTTELVNGVKYKLVAFNADGSFNQAKDYVYGSESNTGPMKLDAGFKYTFVAYSVNSSTDPLPEITYTGGIQTFTNARLLNINEDLMVFIVKDKQISHGDTKLSAIMKHRFSMITTKLSMDPNMTGSIKTLSNVTYPPDELRV